VIFDGKRAVGVEFEQLGARRVVNTRRDVVLCGGAINSPQLLLLSGIGDRDQLAEHGIDVVQHSPDVGNNLLDHRGHTHAPSVLSGEKAADLIRGS
jgi:choline dehydrogenase-like flavoprotein